MDYLRLISLSDGESFTAGTPTVRFLSFVLPSWVCLKWEVKKMSDNLSANEIRLLNGRTPRLESVPCFRSGRIFGRTLWPESETNQD
ncbi:hypothetical protein AVEN_149368-1 [Araneus ventricosus]|uniref:Uncharacterized protein n=1 Tax=Araneus ventricosus TaxID=182803 RepID=A0A4Y2JDR6_ARAVE|nr:hypothetical protein AVEN_149368-1 [Araneus ventricosus]